MDKSAFVHNVKNFCELKGVKPTVACRESGVGTSFINNIEARGQVPSVEKVQILAAYLGVTTSELLGETKDPAPVSEGGTRLNTSKIADRDEQSPLRDTLLHNFNQLNQEGQEKLVDISDDMITSGKYIKTDPDKLGEAQDS